ncbi:hypothetical protein K3495_g5752 [Podosphaera aphanis]|nr:hypothetical protein K3495_g5752 [Podosphaera aphanis]
MTIKASQEINRGLIEKDIIEYIASSEKGKEESERKDIQNVSLVILATPSHVSWLEPSSIQSLLKGIKLSNLNRTQYEIDVIGACVDGLPPHIKQERSEHEESDLQGLSILYGSAITSAQELWPTSELSTDSKELSSLIFQHKCDKSLSSSYKVTVPLANTIFTNGRRSTLLISRWRKTEESVNSIRASSHRDSVSINLLTSQTDYFLKIPVSPLTLPRLIESGLGNIVRSLNIDGKKKIPASQELEAAVMQAHKSKSLPTDHSVWALIIPSHIDSEEIRKVSLAPGCDTKAYITVGNLLKKGAKLCRVVSGGGGWGPKQGLLALDPEIMFRESTASPFDNFETNDSGDEKKKAGLQDLVSKGAFIQFFHMENDQSFDSKHKKAFLGNQFILGTLPNSDENQLLCSNSDSILIPERFGCVSRNGMFLNSTLGGSTKIDIPYSFIQIIDSRDP